MKMNLVCVGDEFKTKYDHLFSGFTITIKKTESPSSVDGYAYFDSPFPIGNRHKKRNHKVRIWWLLDWCNKISKENMLSVVNKKAYLVRK